MTKKKGKSGDYEVGYAKPPRHTQFKPGQSGNRNGRPKRSKNLRSVLREALFKPVTVTENGRPRSMSRLQAIITGLVAKSLKGDVRATEALLRLSNQHFPPGDEVEPLQIFIQRFTDGEILGELKPQADGTRKFEPRSPTVPSTQRAAKDGKSTDEEGSSGS